MRIITEDNIQQFESLHLGKQGGVVNESDKRKGTETSYFSFEKPVESLQKMAASLPDLIATATSVTASMTAPSITQKDTLSLPLPPPPPSTTQIPNPQMPPQPPRSQPPVAPPTKVGGGSDESNVNAGWNGLHSAAVGGGDSGELATTEIMDNLSQGTVNVINYLQPPMPVPMTFYPSQPPLQGGPLQGGMMGSSMTYTLPNTNTEDGNGRHEMQPADLPSTAGGSNVLPSSSSFVSNIATGFENLIIKKLP